jgi:uncharacterized protein YfaP (DUF2135 family)
MRATTRHGMKLLAGFGLLYVCVTVGAADLDSPTGGWRASNQDDSLSDVTAAYPKPPVDRGGQRNRALIQGRIEQTGKDRAPHKFIVNGNPMPLYTDEQGRFIKPWAFGPGSNSVEIRSPDGKQQKRVQFYEAHAGKTQAKIRIILGWDDGKAEVDLHVITPDGQHAFWAHPVLTNGRGLDVDSVDGGGPEIFSLPAAMEGAYHVYVNYYGAGELKDLLTVAQVAIIFNENTPDEKQQVFRVPMRQPGELTLVKSFVYP